MKEPSPQSNIDPAFLSWIDARISSAQTTLDARISSIQAATEARISTSQAAIEHRIVDERDFIKGLLWFTAWVCGIPIVAVATVLTFLGVNKINSVDEKIDTIISTRLTEKTKRLEQDFNEKVQVVVDKALITAYSVDAAKKPHRFNFSSSSPALFASAFR